MRLRSTGPARQLRCRDLTLAIMLGVLALSPASARAFEVKKAGTLKVPAGAQLFAFSTDPTIQQVLSEDFSDAQRGNTSGATVTVSVDVSQQTLKPGVSLGDVAPGDPQVADLIKAAGANPPPLGDTGDQFDQAALSRRMAAQDYMPHDTIGSKTIDDMSRPSGGGGSSEGFGIFHPPIPLPCSGGSASSAGGCQPVPEAAASAIEGKSVGDIASYLQRKQHGNPFIQAKDQSYDTVVVARASVSGAEEEMTLVAVAHADEDVNGAKKQIAEEIANTILH